MRTLESCSANRSALMDSSTLMIGLGMTQQMTPAMQCELYSCSANRTALIGSKVAMGCNGKHMRNARRCGTIQQLMAALSAACINIEVDLVCSYRHHFL